MIRTTVNVEAIRAELRPAEGEPLDRRLNELTAIGDRLNQAEIEHAGLVDKLAHAKAAVPTAYHAAVQSGDFVQLAGLHLAVTTYEELAAKAAGRVNTLDRRLDDMAHTVKRQAAIERERAQAREAADLEAAGPLSVSGEALRRQMETISTRAKQRKPGSVTL